MRLPSPLVGEGCAGLASASELSRSWVRGCAPSARAHPRCAPLIQLRLGSALASPSLRILLPQGEKGKCDCPAILVEGTLIKTLLQVTTLSVPAPKMGAGWDGG